MGLDGESDRSIVRFRRIRKFDSESGYSGWSPVLTAACREMDDLLSQVDPAGSSVVVVDQIKEKFGTLRFYAHVDRERVEEPVGVGSVSAAMPAGEAELPKGILLATSVAENASNIMCMRCGRPAKPGGSGWVRTLCASCDRAFQKSKNRFWDTDADVAVDSLSPAHFAFLTAMKFFEEGLVKEAPDEWMDARVAAAEAVVSFEKARNWLLEAMLRGNPLEPLGSKGATWFNYPLPARFLVLCQDNGLHPERTEPFEGESPLEMAKRLGNPELVSFWEFKALSVPDFGASKKSPPTP